MAKSILKEIIIVLLLCLAIILVLGIMLYDYVPIAKTVPNEVAYVTPAEVKQELLESGSLDESKVVMTYEVDNDDLNNYKRVKDYKPGKANPFSSYEQETTETKAQNTTNATSAKTGEGTTNNGGNTSNSNSNTQEQEKTSEDTASGGHFFQDKGTK